MKKKIIYLIIFIGSVIAISPKILITIKADTYSFQKTYTIETDVNDPISCDEILSTISLAALDGDVDVSSSIINIESGEYITKVLKKPTPDTRLLGTYDVKFKANDMYGNESICTIKVKVIDNEAPKILDYTKYTYTIEKDNYECDELYNVIMNGIYALDNYNLKNVNKELHSSTLNKESDVGTYEVVIKITDSSLNSIFVPINVIINDDTLPYFTAASTFLTFRANEGFETAKIIGEADIIGYTADGNTIIPVISPHNYGEEIYIPGIYTFTLTITDPNDSSKVNTINVFVELIDMDGPEFNLDISTLTVVNSNLFEMNKLNDYIRMKSGKNDFTYKVKTDNYTDNYQEIGEYSYDIIVNYDDGTEEEMNFIMKVIESQEDINKDKNIFEKIWDIIKKISLIIWGIIKWPILKMVSLF